LGGDETLLIEIDCDDKNTAEHQKCSSTNDY